MTESANSASPGTRLRSPLKIHAFVGHYPSVYTPYYDAHFADLLDQGHELTIFALDPLDPLTGRDDRRDRLLARTTYYLPDELRAIPRFATAVASASLHPRWSRRLWQATASQEWAKDRLKAFVRSLSLPRVHPDVRIVHGHATLRLFEWLKDLDQRVPLVFYFHGGVPREGGGIATPGPEVEAADIVFTNSPHAKEVLESSGVESAKIEILPVGFDLSAFESPSPRQYRLRGRLNLVSVGRLSEGKGYTYAIRAVARLLERRPERDLRYTIVGGGVLERELRDLIEDLELIEHVTLAGPLGNREVIRLLGRSDALVFPSVTTPYGSETQGTVIQEAMLMGALPITSCTGGVCDSIPPFLEFLHVPERDEGALTTAMERVDAMTKSDLADIGGQARKWTRERYDVRAFNDRLLSLSLDEEQPVSSIDSATDTA